MRNKHDANESFLKETIKVWQSHNGTPLSLEDARTITANMTEYIEFLNKMDKKYNGKEKKI